MNQTPSPLRRIPIAIVHLLVPGDEAVKLRKYFRVGTTIEAVLGMAWLWNIPEDALKGSRIVSRRADGSEELDVVIPQRQVERMKSLYGKSDAGEALLGALLFMLAGAAISEAISDKGSKRKKR